MVVTAAGPLRLAQGAPAAPAPVRSDREEARTRFQHGVELFRDGDPRAALIEFRRAYELAPNFRVLFNIGQASFEAQDYPSAVLAFQRYLAEGGKDVPAARRAQIEGDIKRLEARLAHLTITTNVAGAEVLVDDVSVGRTPLPAPLVVGMGRRKLAVVATDRETQTRLVDLAGGDNTTIDLPFPIAKLANRPLPEAQDAPLPPAEGHVEPFAINDLGNQPHRTPWLQVGWIATGVLAAATVTTGFLALHAKNDFEHTLDQQLDARQTLDEQRSRTRRWALTTDILGGATIAVGLTTLAGWFFSRRGETSPVGVSLAMDGVSVSRRF